MQRNYNLILMTIWLFMGVCLMAPEWVLPEKARQQVVGPATSTFGIAALALAAYNLIRWWSIRSRYRDRTAARPINPLAVRRVEREPEKYEPNPDLDFLKLPDADSSHPPEPSANGDH